MPGKEQTMESKNDDWTPDEEEGFFRRMIGWPALDNTGHRVGVVDAEFEDHAGHPDLLGVRVGTMGFSRMHVVPAQFCEIDEHERLIRLPFVAWVVENAPAFDADFEFTEEAEKHVYEYYRKEGFPIEDYGLRERT
ncbi:MAG: hypothetical protein JWO30_3209 [Fibrobacteres bacterium]|nr:hypothetical protein [Fibrobacterota bacterium]